MRENADQNNSKYGHFLRIISLVVMELQESLAAALYEKYSIGLIAQMMWDKNG